MTKSAVHALKSGTVLDRSVLVTLSSAALQELLEAFRSNFLGIMIVVDDANRFFTSDNMLKLIKAGDENYRLIAEKTGITVTEADVEAIRRVEAILAHLRR